MAKARKSAAPDPVTAPEDDGAGRPLLVDGQGGEGDEVRLAVVDDGPDDGDGQERDGQGTRSGSEDRGDGQRRGGKRDQVDNLNAALREERDKGRRLLSDLEDQRARTANAERRAQEAEQTTTRAKRFEEMDEKPLSESIPLIEETLVRPAFQKARADHVRLSQKVAKRDYPDYDKVLRESGVEDGITLVNGQPKDPVLWRRLLIDAEDPGEEAYLIGKELLRQRSANGRGAGEEDDEDPEVLDQPAGDRAAGRREVIERLDRNGQRPRGIREIPSADPGVGTRRLSRKQIDAMAPEERARVLSPAALDEWLMGAP